MTFAHLHVHTPFSFLDGAASVKGLARAAAQWDMPALAMTDHNNVSAAVQFHHRTLRGLSVIIRHQPFPPLDLCWRYSPPSGAFSQEKSTASAWADHPAVQERPAILTVVSAGGLR